ncbi:MAG: PAP2 family protein, partial [Comamonadaceae bacterium]
MAADPVPWAAWAQQLGAHALPVFVSALVAAVAVAGLAGLLLHRRRARRPTPDDAAPPTLLRLAVAFASGFALIVGAASLFAAIAGRLGPDRAMALADQALADAIGQHTP